MTTPNVIAVDPARLNQRIEQSQTQPTVADALRSIDNLTAEARRALDNGGDRQVACALAMAHLTAIRLTVQNGLRDSLADARKLEAYPALLSISIEIARLYCVTSADWPGSDWHRMVGDIAGEARDVIAKARSKAAPDAQGADRPIESYTTERPESTGNGEHDGINN